MSRSITMYQNKTCDGVMKSSKSVSLSAPLNPLAILCLGRGQLTEVNAQLAKKGFVLAKEQDHTSGI